MLDIVPACAAMAFLACSRGPAVRVGLHGISIHRCRPGFKTSVKPLAGAAAAAAAATSQITGGPSRKYLRPVVCRPCRKESSKRLEPEPTQDRDVAGTAKASGRRSSWTYLFERLFKDLAKYSASPRRDATYWLIVLSSLALVVASDFLGVTRWLLSFNPEAAQKLGLDQVYQVQGLKAFRQPQRYRLRYPGQWLFDLSVAVSKESMLEMPLYRKKKLIVPDAAFGPPGGGLASAAKRENLSVVVQPVQAVESLEVMLGDPRQAFDKLVSARLAPPGSGRSVEVLSTGQRQQPGATPIYEFEYLLSKSEREVPVVLHTWSAVALGSRDTGVNANSLFTMTIVAPEESLTSERRSLFVECWRSFELDIS